MRAVLSGVERIEVRLDCPPTGTFILHGTLFISVGALRSMMEEPCMRHLDGALVFRTPWRDVPVTLPA